jgi:hypothetical protein
MESNGINNVIASGAIEKFRNSSMYDYKRYESFINKSLKIQSSNANLRLTIGSSSFEQNLKSLFYDNFCRTMSYILNETVSYEFDTICD